MSKQIENFEFVQIVIFEFIESLKNNGTKYLLIFEESCEEICNSKTFFDIATTGWDRGLSTFYIKLNLFHQSKLKRDIELQNLHIVVLKSPRDVIQVSTFSTQLELWSEVADWYRHATSVPYGHFMSDLSPLTDDRIYSCKNTGCIPSNFFIPDQLKQSKFLDDERTTILYSPSVPITFPQMQKPFPSVLSNRVYRVPLGMFSWSSPKKPAEHKKTSRNRISKWILIAKSKKNHLEARKGRSGIQQKVTTHKSNFSSRQ